MASRGVFTGTIWLIWVGAAAAQTLGQGAGGDVPWLRLIAALLLCLGLAVGAAFALHRRMGGGAPDFTQIRWLEAIRGLSPAAAQRKPGRISGIESRRLSPQATASVFTCDGRDYLVVTSAQGQIEMISLPQVPPGTEQ